MAYFVLAAPGRRGPEFASGHLPREYNARLRGKELEKGESASPEIVLLSPLPCWSHLAPEVYRGRIQEMVREINESAAAARAESLIEPLGPEGVRAQNPETRPRKIKRSPAPFFHALRKKVRKALWEAYGGLSGELVAAADRASGSDREDRMSGRARELAEGGVLAWRVK